MDLDSDVQTIREYVTHATRASYVGRNSGPIVFIEKQKSDFREISQRCSAIVPNFAFQRSVLKFKVVLKIFQAYL